MALTNEQKRRVGKAFAKYAFKISGTTANLHKGDFEAEMDAIETWILDNQASFKAVLSSGFKTKATNAQISLLFAFVALEMSGELDKII